MADLPRPNVQVTTSTTPDGLKQYAEAIISRDGKVKSYTGMGESEASRTKDIVEKIIGDRKSAEWLP